MGARDVTDIDGGVRGLSILRLFVDKTIDELVGGESAGVWFGDDVLRARCERAVYSGWRDCSCS